MSESVARLLIELEHVKPCIWRRVDVPVSMTLIGLHSVIQTVMLWEDRHLFEFRIGDRRFGRPSQDDALFGREVLRAGSQRLGRLITQGIRSFTYTYDFGDNWEHLITIEGSLEGDPRTSYPAFVDGERRAPPEDVGGPPGFETFIEAMQDPKHPEYREMRSWYGGPFRSDETDTPRIIQGLSRLARRRLQPALGGNGRSAEPK